MQKYINAGTNALGKQTGVQDAMMELLGLGGGNGGGGGQQQNAGPQATGGNPNGLTGTAKIEYDSLTDRNALGYGNQIMPFDTRVMMAARLSGEDPQAVAQKIAAQDPVQAMSTQYFTNAVMAAGVDPANKTLTNQNGQQVYASAYNNGRSMESAFPGSMNKNPAISSADPNRSATIAANMPGAGAPNAANVGGDQNGGAGGAGGAGAAGGANSAFQNYLNSTGYQFRLGQGIGAIEGSQAVGGALNSGATLRALTKYGQNLGSAEFSNYLNQLGNMNNILGATAAAGQSGLGQIATVGTSGGGQAANAIMQGASNQGAAIMQGGNAMANGIAGLAGGIGNTLGNMGNSGWW